MSKAVEGALSKMMGEAKGGDEAGAKELKLLKDRNVSRLYCLGRNQADIVQRLKMDVWS
jgi:hypothetical protein